MNLRDDIHFARSELLTFLVVAGVSLPYVSHLLSEVKQGQAFGFLYRWDDDGNFLDKYV